MRITQKQYQEVVGALVATGREDLVEALGAAVKKKSRDIETEVLALLKSLKIPHKFDSNKGEYTLKVEGKIEDLLDGLEKLIPNMKRKIFGKGYYQNNEGRVAGTRVRFLWNLEHGDFFLQFD